MEGTRGCRQHDTAGNRRITREYARCELGAQTMPDYVNALGINLVLLPQESDRAQRIVDGFAVDGEILIHSEHARVRECTFIVTQGGDAARCQTLRQITQRGQGTDSAIAILRPEPCTRTAAGKGPSPFGMLSVPSRM